MNMFTKWSFSIEIILKDLDVIGVLLCAVCKIKLEKIKSHL